jgi:hypothetical protein
MHCVVLEDTLQYFAALAVAFIMGTLRHFCSDSSSQQFTIFARFLSAVNC